MGTIRTQVNTLWIQLLFLLIIGARVSRFCRYDLQYSFKLHFPNLSLEVYENLKSVLIRYDLEENTNRFIFGKLGAITKWLMG